MDKLVWRRSVWIVAAAPVVLAAALVWSMPADGPASSVAAPAAEVRGTAAEVARLNQTLAGLRPRGIYLTVDTVANRLQVRRGGEVLREALCSTGTNTELLDPQTGNRWVFETPRGIRTVQNKRRNPVWTRPDWSFVEEGVAPPSRWAERIERGVLGAWALDLGGNYMIHGTLFQRYLGRSVTHGCIRLGDADLEYVARVTPVGASVLLF